MEFCDYSFDDFIHNPKFQNVKSIVFFFRQILTGLIYLHEHRIVHRDFKPGNILVTKDYVVKIGDFGMSRYLADARYRGYTAECICTYYKPPEFYRITPRKALNAIYIPNYCEKVDIWAVGLMLSEMMGSKITPKQILTQRRTTPEFFPLLTLEEDLEMASRIIIFEPKYRSSAKAILNSRFFQQQIF
ncbi:mitogen-activated protein kinase, putative [Entamoeba invadens IP1]|uniref:Mitogen-activated protein kinase, putative n=1 Tax=Entamoeba invadens IP1 TaxID=370355 RepID=A0A0A1U5V7_ENTIV|nr:mitogen-activated protein kinase, putative [Entamoeba invadens IP1]ELP89641.1 mitogen-activated protein kinase, putative [Entamoeba invadens IP1]|eukprot:XP_004256412.1 mitogen-activated protein kinase, putative [Entamoeba invadens IP1]